MELNGACSNPLGTDKGLQLKRLLGLKKRVEERPTSIPQGARPGSRRRGAVLAAVTTLLEVADAPLRYIESRRVWRGYWASLCRRPP